MDYIIWSKEEFGDSWRRVDCGDKGAVKRELLSAMKEGREPILTVEVSFDLQLNIGEPRADWKEIKPLGPIKDTRTAKEKAKDETNQDKAEQN